MFLRLGGEGGIRTLGTLLGYGALAKRCFRPLSHLTKTGGFGGHPPSRCYGATSRPPLQFAWEYEARTGRVKPMWVL